MNASKLVSAISAVMFFASPVFAQAPVNPQRDPAAQVIHNNQTGEKIGVATSFPVKSKLTGLSVRNSAGEKLGTVEDIVINLQDGKAQYLALSFGGVLGIGSKYFAVPFNEVRFNHGKEEMYFVLDVPKEKLESAPGFDKNDWPDFADPKWRNEIDSYYRTNTQGTATRPGAPSNAWQ